MLSTTASMTSRAGRRGGVADISIMTGWGISRFPVGGSGVRGGAGSEAPVILRGNKPLGFLLRLPLSTTGCPNPRPPEPANPRAQLSFNQQLDVLRKSERNY